MGQNRVKILPAFSDDGRQPDDLRPGPDYDQQLQPPVSPEMFHTKPLLSDQTSS